MKKFILFLFFIAIVSVGIGFFGSSIFSKTLISKNTHEENNEYESSANNSLDITVTPTPAVFDTALETEAINTLIKSYLVSSLDFDWDTVVSLTTGSYKDDLVNNIIPKMNELLKEKEDIQYEFNPRSIKVKINSLQTKESIATVNYIITRGVGEEKITTQEEIKIFLTKESGTWLIFSVDV